ncbi:MAG: hypothetical protein AAF485_04800, partial [Chloroflexota bacterium]
MSLPNKYNQMFVDYTNIHQAGYNDAEEKYGVTVATVADPSQPHWRVVGVHHLDHTEGGGNNVYIDILDSEAIRIFGASAEAKNINGFVEQLQINKALPDHGADFVLFGQDTKQVYVTHDGLPSDVVNNIHTRHADEEGGVTFAHHAFYAVFQYSPGTTSSDSQNGSGGSTTEPADEADLDTRLWATGEPLVQAFNRNAALYKKAQELGLGEHLTVEYEVLHEGQAYLAQIFELGLVYAPMGQWDQVQILESGTRSITPHSGGQVAWDHHVTGFYGSRWDFFAQHVQPHIPEMSWQLFNETFTQHNPHVVQDSGVIQPQKTYLAPRRAGQPASPEILPAETTAQPAVNGAVATPGVIRAEEVFEQSVIPPEFVQIHNEKFHIKGKAERFIGVNIRGLVHYGQDPHYFEYAPVEHREIQLQGASEMNARLVRIFLAHKDGTPQEIERRLRDTLALMKAKFPNMYLLPAFTNLYKDVPFYVQGDEKFYESQSPGGREILNHAFYRGGYQENYLSF